MYSTNNYLVLFLSSVRYYFKCLVYTVTKIDSIPTFMRLILMEETDATDKHNI